MSPQRNREEQVRRILLRLWPYADEGWIDVAVERILAAVSEET